MLVDSHCKKNNKNQTNEKRALFHSFLHQDFPNERFYAKNYNTNCRQFFSVWSFKVYFYTNSYFLRIQIPVTLDFHYFSGRGCFLIFLRNIEICEGCIYLLIPSLEEIFTIGLCSSVFWVCAFIFSKMGKMLCIFWAFSNVSVKPETWKIELVAQTDVFFCPALNRLYRSKQFGPSAVSFAWDLFGNFFAEQTFSTVSEQK